MSVLMSARMVDTFTDFVPDGERKKITTRTMASVTRSNNKLVLIHFPLLDIRNPLYHQASSAPKGLPMYAIQMEVLLTGLRRLTLASNSFVAYYNTPYGASRRGIFHESSDLWQHIGFNRPAYICRPVDLGPFFVTAALFFGVRCSNTTHIRRASTSPLTSLAPAVKRGAAHASNVAPVVATSSMITIIRPTSAPVA